MDSTAIVKFSELVDAFHFVSGGPEYENEAFIDPTTGTVFWVSELIDEEDEVPDDLETSDRYIRVPHKNDLDLGRDLVFSFVEEELPDEYETVRGFFRRKGAYGRFKDLLEARGLLDKWYAFEASAIESALRAWCEETGIEIVDELTGDVPLGADD